MRLALLLSGGAALAVVLASVLYHRYFDLLAGTGGSERARRVLRTGVASGGVLVGVGVFGAALDATATVASFAPTRPGPVERALLAVPTGWLPWLVAVGTLLVVASGVVASAAQVRARYRD